MRKTIYQHNSHCETLNKN